MSDDCFDGPIDIPFQVPFVHRLRVTRDVTGIDLDQLLGVLRVGESLPVKVFVVAETSLGEPARKIFQGIRNAPSLSLVDEPLLVDGGETIKNTSDVVQQLLHRINDVNLDRQSYLIAIGGGAMLDAVGFAAAIAHRGIRLVRLPTTTLAQADSGVGVKNAINYFEKKNWIGTFAVPWAVINDDALLATLPDREYRSGFSEAVKVCLLKSPEQFEWLNSNAARIRDRERSVARRAIDQSCMLHLRHITEGGDPFEMLQSRPLDFGHWSAHKLEPLTEYALLHGEAVAIGVAIDCFYSSLKLGFPETDARRVCDCLKSMGLPLWHEQLRPIDRLMTGLEEFRQHLGGQLTVTMLTKIGKPVDVHEIDDARMIEAIEMLASYAGEPGAD